MAMRPEDTIDLRTWAHKAADWTADYRDGLDALPVRPRVVPGSIAARIPTAPPETAEPMEAIFADFERVIAPGMTHWQHPRFFAYFPGNAAPAAVVAEMLVAGMSAQCMLWQTSPAATELETRVLDWLRQALDLPPTFQGVIHDTASSATLAAVLTMRERALGFTGNATGLADTPRLRIYASGEVHSSIDKAVRIAGIGEDNLVRVPTAGPTRGMDTAALEAAIAADRAAGHKPAGIVACVGGTSVGALDDVTAIATIANREGLHLHVDAAWAGAAMICPEFRPLWQGVASADSVVMNPHKWLGAPFDCSTYFVRAPEDLVRTLAIHPEYLKTYGRDGMVNYSEWSIQLGRRFRALKLWFLIRAHGLEGLRAMIRDHVAWSRDLAARLGAEPDFEIVTAPMLSLFTFRHLGAAGGTADAHNLALVEAINDDGRTYLTQTRVDGRIAIRLQVGSFQTTAADLDIAFEAITGIARALDRTHASTEPLSRARAAG